MIQKTILLLLPFLVLLSCTQREKTSPYPNIAGTPVTDIYHGVAITDPYRNLEDLEDSTVINWLQNQAVQSRRILENIPGREKLITLQQQLKGTYTSTISRLKITTNGTSLFYLKQGPNEKHPKLYYRAAMDQAEELLYDPTQFLPEKQEQYYINYLKPSWDGTKLLIGFTKNGEEFSEVRILDLPSRTLLPIEINNTMPDAVGMYWLPDNSGVTYLRFPMHTKKDKEAYHNTEAVLQKLDGSSKILFSKKNNPDLAITPKDLVAGFIDNATNKYMLGVVTGATPYDGAYYIPISDIHKAAQQWKPLYTKSDQLGVFFQDQDSLVYMTSKNASNFRICKTSILTPDFENPKVVVAEKEDEVIKAFRLTKEGMFYTTTKNGVQAKLYCLNHSGEHTEIPLPFKAGTLALRAKTKNDSYLEIRIEGWLHKEQRYVYDFDTATFNNADLSTSNSAQYVNDLMVEEVLVPSHDGAEVPLSLVYKKGLKKDGSTPVFMIGYGAYGRSITPSFTGKITSYALEGGIFAIAHVRGGGEKGDAWYKAGYKTTKPNTWKDLIACAEYLIDQKYTATKKIAIHGGSAGGITVGRAMTERPDLFGAVIASVGCMNVLRSETGMNGSNNTKEFGTVKDPEEFKALLEMDAYHHTQQDVAYPPTLVTAGINDARVPIWHSAKFVAKLQDANSATTPILFDIDFESGHGSSSKDKRMKNVTDVLSFAFWQTGHPDYQPEE